MKDLRKKVVSAFVVLMFALLSLVGTTFAWFTVASSVDVSALQLTVKTEESLLVRVYNGELQTDLGLLDATTYVTTVTNELLTANLYSDLSTWALSPVTVIQDDYASMNGKVMNYLDGLTSYARPLALIGTSINSATGKVIEFKFWVLSQGETSKNIELATLNITTSYGLADVRDSIKNAVRIAVWANNDASYVYGLDEDYEFTFTENLPGYFGGVQSLLEFDSLANHTDLNLELEANTYVPAEFIDANITLATYNTPILFTVRIFVEGWDAQTTNNIIAAAFSIAFSFKFEV